MDKDDNRKPIGELCKPLSAKIIPAKGMWATGGRLMTDDMALSAQRRSGHGAPAAGKGKNSKTWKSGG